MRRDLDILDAEMLGFDSMTLVKAIPGVLEDAGKAMEPKKAPPKDLKPPVPEPGMSTPVKVGIGVGVGGALLLLLRSLRR